MRYKSIKISLVVMLAAVLLLAASCGNAIEYQIAGNYPETEAANHTRDILSVDFTIRELNDVRKTETSDIHRVADGVYLIMDTIPEGVDIAEFLQELGYDSFREHEQLSVGSVWHPNVIVLRTNARIEDLRIIGVLPHDVADFSLGWEIMRLYQRSGRVWTTMDLLPHEPFVMGWRAEEWGLTESGITGVAFIDSDGHERSFVLQLSDEGATYLKEFEDTRLAYYEARLSIIQPTSEIEFIMADIGDNRPLPWQERDGSVARERFLQQFDHYIELGADDTVHDRWSAFIANANLSDFQIFRLGIACEWYVYVDDEIRVMRPFYIRSVSGSVDMLPAGVPLVVPFSWTPLGPLPQFGVSFVDETGKFHAFMMQENTASGSPPMFITPFIDRMYCSFCIGTEEIADETETPLTMDLLVRELNDMRKTETSDIHLVADGVYLIIDTIPEGVEPAEFLRELGYLSYVDHEDLQQWWRSDMIVLRTNAEIEGLRIISVEEVYSVDFSEGMDITHGYCYCDFWNIEPINILSHEPFVMGWEAESRFADFHASSWGGEQSQVWTNGISFMDGDGRERFFVLQQSDNGATYLKEFESFRREADPERYHYDELIILIHPSPEIYLTMSIVGNLPTQTDDGYARRDGFLRQFNSYIDLEVSDIDWSWQPEMWYIFVSNVELRDFQVLRLETICGVRDSFYIGNVRGSVDVLPAGVPLLIRSPWLMEGLRWEHGFSFVDGHEQLRTFTARGKAISQINIREFVDRVYYPCPHCTSMED